MKIKEWLENALAQQFMGKTIKGWQGHPFVVAQISVEYGGPDPQWEISFRSARNVKALENGPSYSAIPHELLAEWLEACKEHYYITLPEDKVPELV